MPDRATIEPHVVQAVRDLLQRAPSYHRLPDGDRRKLVDGMIDVAGTLALDDAPAGEALPHFVRELVEGTFAAVVDGSIEQLKAYAELIGSISADGDDVPRIHERLGRPAARPARAAHPGVVVHKIKWPP
jgi:hypothetical protein